MDSSEGKAELLDMVIDGRIGSALQIELFDSPSIAESHGFCLIHSIDEWILVWKRIVPDFDVSPQFDWLKFSSDVSQTLTQMPVSIQV